MCLFEISAQAIYSNIKLDHDLSDVSLWDLGPSVLSRYQYYFRSLHFIIKLDPSTSSQIHLPLASYQPYSTRPSCFWAFNLPIVSANSLCSFSMQALIKLSFITSLVISSCTMGTHMLVPPLITDLLMVPADSPHPLLDVILVQLTLQSSMLLHPLVVFC